MFSDKWCGSSLDVVRSSHVFAVGFGHVTVYLEHSVLVDLINVCATVRVYSLISRGIKPNMSMARRNSCTPRVSEYNYANRRRVHKLVIQFDSLF